MLLILNALVGALCGMLVNYLADVLPATRWFTRPMCRTCVRPYTVGEYLSFVRCAGCGTRRAIRTWLVVIGGIMAGIGLHFFPFSILSGWAALPLLVFLGAVVVIDIEHRLVLFETSLFGMVLFTVYGVILRGFTGTLLGGLGGFAILFAMFILGVVFSRVLGKLRKKTISEVAFGFGDVMAGTFLGLLTGWPGIAAALLAAMLLFGAFSLVYLISLIVSKRYRVFGNALPFVPFLVLGTVVLFYL